jgi:CO/xanthine dehydrogenase Mo-binding subunit
VNGLARESAIDELAELAGSDPVSFRVTLLRDKPRLLAVMRAAVEKSGWKPTRGSSGQGYGLGLNWTDGTYVAEVAKVSVDKPTGKVRVEHIDAAIDCGLVVNRMAAMRQVEGSIVMQGTSSTMNEQLQFSNGRVTTTSLAQYRPLGFVDAPSVDVVFVEDRSQPMQGIGEPAVGAVSAAISNAIYDAAGIRLRDLPFLPEKVQAAIGA